MKPLRILFGALALITLAPVLVFSDVVPDPPVRLLRALLDAGTANRIVVNNGSGVMADAAAITASRVLISDSNGIPTANAALTASRALQSDPNGLPIASATISDTELGMLDGASSNIQAQLTALGAGGFVKLATYSPSGATSVDITSLSSTYDAYLIVYHLAQASGTLTEIPIQTDYDGGASWDTSNYSYQVIRSTNAGTITGTGSNSAPFVGISGGGNDLRMTNLGDAVAGEIFIANRGSAFRRARWTWSARFFGSTSNNGVSLFGAGDRLDNGIVNAIRLASGGVSTFTGVVRLYGLAN